MKTLNEDELVKEILNIIESVQEPLETEEIVSRVKASRTKVRYRLNNLRAEGKVSGKMLGSGKGVWIWWNNRPTLQIPSQSKKR